ncbi:hypothetical protein BV898_11098 [Hypsibius exemplaris]|uniref:Uncharacterized protein n=1 Tax=Hypsibius exemplaris TaxID=2072580 RepID=A0A1W0WHQ4_HYPEX|nr:hypothetical protein BV898_11098 [Hypsibius exemplaris]
MLQSSDSEEIIWSEPDNPGKRIVGRVTATAREGGIGPKTEEGAGDDVAEAQESRRSTWSNKGVPPVRLGQEKLGGPNQPS